MYENLAIFFMGYVVIDRLKALYKWYSIVPCKMERDLANLAKWGFDVNSDGWIICQEPEPEEFE